jgi:uncharacterized protein (TIGR01777 family)
MRIAISGASGLVGTALCEYLGGKGHEVLKLVRRPIAGKDEIRWDPEAGVLPAGAFSDVDAVVNLAGENIASGRWTTGKKKRILDSRVNATRLISRALAEQNPKAVLLSASALGYYGDCGDRPVDESCPAGRDFLASVCTAWEAATGTAAEAGVRVVCYRIGIVLSAHGGALAQMLPVFRAGLGGRLATGRQWMSWIAMDDLVRGIEHCILTPGIQGPVNAGAPHPLTNEAFTKALAKALRRPAILPVPALAVRLALGEMGDALLLSSTRMLPARLASSNFVWEYPELPAALEHLLMD